MTPTDAEHGAALLAAAGQEHLANAYPTETGWRIDCSCGWSKKTGGRAVEAFMAAEISMIIHLRIGRAALQASGAAGAEEGEHAPDLPRR